MKTLKIAGAALALYVFAGNTPAMAQSGRSADHWVGTWGTAMVARPQSAPPGLLGQPAPAGQPGQGPQGSQGRGQPLQPSPLNFSNQTLRQIVHTSIGGDRVRVVLSNVFGTAPLMVGAVNVALRQKEAAIVPSSARALTFGGSPATTIAAGAIAMSDPVGVAVPAFADLAIDIFLPGDTATSPSPVTVHNGALQTNYVSTTGNYSGATDLPVMTTTQSWFFLSRVEVAAPDQIGAVVALGDSITDGTLSTPDTNNRWTDHLAKRLMAQATSARTPQTAMMGVLNEGIAGNRVLSDFVGPSALARFDRDVLAQSGVTHIILLEGINDFGLTPAGQTPPTAAEIIAGHRQIIERAHAHGLKVIGATMLPFEGTNLVIAPGYYSPEKDARRQAVNEWIRTGRAYDGVVDFDLALRDPSHPSQLLPQYKGADNLHLNDAGYQAMANAVNLALLRR
jgi:lysophospholipase L1-like esterase